MDERNRLTLSCDLISDIGSGHRCDTPCKLCNMNGMLWIPPALTALRYLISAMTPV
ncbi:MAG TPA: hypothetical protein VFQ25_12205 [Ktedonobacterales bacterium]|nr:hypothetical protein [Ktedonobacterales bacterium]